MIVSDIRFHPAAEDLRATGLRGWATVTVDGTWIFNSIAVRRAADGRYVLAFPTRTDSAGKEHSFVRPAGSAVRAKIEEAVLGHLRRGGWIQ